MYCSNCGTKCNKGAKFCGNCGNVLDNNEEQTETSAMPVATINNNSNNNNNYQNNTNNGYPDELPLEYKPISAWGYFGYQLLFGRLLFPSFYFDAFEKILNHEEDEKSIMYFNGRIREYELYLNDIYVILSQYSDLEPIDWLIKKT